MELRVCMKGAAAVMSRGERAPRRPHVRRAPDRDGAVHILVRKVLTANGRGLTPGSHGLASSRCHGLLRTAIKSRRAFPAPTIDGGEASRSFRDACSSEGTLHGRSARAAVLVRSSTEGARLTFSGAKTSVLLGSH